MQGWGGWCWQGNGAEWRTSVLRRCSQIGRFWFLLYSGRIFKDTRKSAVFGLFRSRFLKCLQIGSGGRGSSWPPGIQPWSSTRWWRWSKKTFCMDIFLFLYFWTSVVLSGGGDGQEGEPGRGGDAGGRRAGAGCGGAACNSSGWPAIA